MKNLNEEHGLSFIFASHDDTDIKASNELYSIEWLFRKLMGSEI
jgi:ABC-type microcin C transport system duplicated ATPase subunit YejF